MSLRLRILNGPLKGRFTPIKAGIVIGRGPNRLTLRDSKISSSHARIVEDPKGLILRDLDSRNGIKVDGRRVKELRLEPGAQFQLGRTMIQVEGEKREQPPLPVTDEEVPEIEVPPPDWPEYFQEFINTTRSKIKDKEQELVPFPAVLQLKFLRGPHIDTVWNMGYGPRIVGRGSLDFPLYDDGVPDLAFRIRAKDGHILLETPHSKLVQLNEKFVSTEELKDGDFISVGSCLIEVSFKETK